MKQICRLGSLDYACRMITITVVMAICKGGTYIMEEGAVRGQAAIGPLTAPVI